VQARRLVVLLVVLGVLLHLRVAGARAVDLLPDLGVDVGQLVQAVTHDVAVLLVQPRQLELRHPEVTSRLHVSWFAACSLGPGKLTSEWKVLYMAITTT